MNSLNYKPPFLTFCASFTFILNYEYENGIEDWNEDWNEDFNWRLEWRLKYANSEQQNSEKNKFVLILNEVHF